MKWKLVLLACTLLGAMNLVTSLPVSAQLYWNNAAAFNGASRVSFQNATAINLTGSFTLEAWVNPSQAPTIRAGVIAKESESGFRQYALSLNTSGGLELGTNGVTRLTSKTTSVIQNNLWTHVAGTYNSATNLFSIYINGALDTTTTVPS
ncbi:MAG: LamG domain-containing protein, partial [Rhizobacter sp.]|nr:LamG domain-containing protein [Chlorobiales bacterium]